MGDDGVQVFEMDVFRNLVLIRSTQSIMQCVGSLCIGAGTPVICILPLDLMNFARVDELTRLYTVYLPTTLM